MHHGITLHSGTAVQEVNVKFAATLNKVQGMVDDATQYVAGYSHSEENSGSVRGKGALTIAPGFGDAGVTGISGGLTHIDDLSIKESIGQEAEWTYNFTHLPHAA